MEKIALFVVPHTHWDREWYMSFQTSRYLFVDLVEGLINLLESRKDFKHFNLDGQAANINDYLEINPEKQETIRQYFSAGRLSAGPWYVLADEFMVSAESLVRNLMLGKNIVSKLGQKNFEGYMPDSFGHTTQLPQILKGFNINSIIFMRGMGNEIDNLKNEFLWESPDGSSVFAHCLYFMYCNASTLYADPQKGWASDELPNNKSLLNLIEEMLKRSTTKNLLLLNGGDHLRAQTNLPDIIAEWNKNIGKKYSARITDLTEWVEAVKRSKPSLKTYKGEMRGAKNREILHGCISSHMYLKQQNRMCEILLENWAEPISSIAWLEGKQYPKNRLWEAWKVLINNQAHDSIGGTCISEVHREMECRFDQVAQISNISIENGLRYIGHKILTDDEGTNFMVFNSTNWNNSGEVFVKIDPIGDERGFRYFGGREAKWNLDIDKYTLFDSEGKIIPFKIHGIKRRIKDVLDGCRVTEEMHISFLAKDVPPYGYKVYTLKQATGADNRYENSIKVVNDCIENSYYKIGLNSDGSLNIKDKISDREFKGINSFEDSGDVGDCYIYCPPDNDEVIDRPDKVESKIVEDLGWKATLEVTLIFHLPYAIDKSRKKRESKLVDYKVVSQITLYSEINRIDISTKLHNVAKDHRFRVLFPTDFNTDSILAEEPFNVIKRDIGLPPADDWYEKPTPTQPHRLFLQLIDKNKNDSFIISAQGMPEYELKPNRRTIALTLVRSVGWMSRSDVEKVRKGGLRDLPVSEAQCLRDFEFNYSITTASEDKLNYAYQHATTYSYGLQSIQLGTNEQGTLGKELSFFELNPKEVIVSCIKVSEDENSMIIRIYNPGKENVVASLVSYRSILSAESVSLEEIPDGKNDIELLDNRSIKVPVSKKRIRSVRLKFW
jgi:mannosylglycerate hydrolase